MVIVDKIIVVDTLGLNYIEVKNRVAEIFIEKYERGEYEVNPIDCTINLKKVEIDFTPNSTDVGLRYIYEVIYAT